MDITKSLSWIYAWDGAAATPSISFGSDPDTGFYSYGANTLGIAIGGVDAARFGANYLWLKSDTGYLAFGAALDTALVRDAANVLALKNGANAQTFRIYGTTTGPKYLSLLHNGTSGYILTNDSADLYLGTNNTNRWMISTAGNLVAAADNTYDIGANGATRPKNVYAVKYYGDGSALTGITGATGGISNTGSTTIASDTDNSGAEDIAFATSTATRWLVKGGTGHFVPNVASTYDIGDTTLKIRYAYINAICNGTIISNSVYGAQLTSSNRIALASIQNSGETSAGSIIDLATTWNNAGNTPTAIKLNVTDTASNAASLLMDLQVGGSSKFYVSKAGAVYSAGAMLPSGIINGAAYSYSWTSSSKIYGDTDGIIRLTNNAGSDFSRLQFGGTTAAFPSIRRTGTQIDFVLADASAFAPIKASVVTAESYLTVAAANPASTGAIRLANNTLIYSRNAANSGDNVLIGLDTNNSVQLGEGGGGLVVKPTLMQFVGATNAYPALKRSSAALELKLADDSARTDLYLNGLFASYVATGSNYASTGAVRLANDGDIYYRNAANNADMMLIGSSNVNDVYVGNAGATTRIATSLAVPTSLADGHWWVEATGVSPARSVKLCVRDGGSTRVLAEMTY